MKASQANEMKPIVDGLAAGERWQYLPHGEGWRDIRGDDHILLEDAKRYRKKPEPLRFWVMVDGNGNPGYCYTEEEVKSRGEWAPGVRERLVETVEVLK